MVLSASGAMAYCKIATLNSQHLHVIQVFCKGSLCFCGLLVLMAACSTVQKESFIRQEMKVQNEIRHNGIISLLELDRNVISDETTPSLQVVFTIKNMTPSPISFTFSSSQQYDFLIQDESGRQHWKWSDDKFFAMMIVEKELGQEPWVYRESVPLVNRDGTFLTKGQYTLRARFTSENGIENRMPFRVE